MLQNSRWMNILEVTEVSHGMYREMLRQAISVEKTSIHNVDLVEIKNVFLRDHVLT